jgi:hypothetical protein
MQIYRQNNGNLDNWRRYIILINGERAGHLSSLQLLELDRSERFDIHFEGHGLESEKIHVQPNETRSLVVATTANPKIETPQIRTRWVDDEELKQIIVRFDTKSPRIGKLGGRARAFFATLIYFGASLVIIAGGISEGISEPTLPTIAFLVVVGGGLEIMLVFILASLFRGFYFYFRMPRELKS